jgi:hypothetical protein
MDSRIAGVFVTVSVRAASESRCSCLLPSLASFVASPAKLVAYVPQTLAFGPGLRLLLERLSPTNCPVSVFL